VNFFNLSCLLARGPRLKFNRLFLWQPYDILIQSARFQHVHILHAAKRWICTNIYQDSFKAKRPICIETERQSHRQKDYMAKPTQLVVLIENTLWGLPHPSSFNALHILLITEKKMLPN